MLNDTTLNELRRVQEIAGQASRNKGFHEEGDLLREIQADITASGTLNPQMIERSKAALRNYYANKLMLIVSEAVEAHDEIRTGQEVAETYYPEGYNSEDSMGNPNGPWVNAGKPEGVPSEVADIVIRCFDFADEGEFDLASIISEKLAYNATRAHRHGGKKF